MNIKNYSRKKDGQKNITQNIKVYEVACKDGTDAVKMDYVICCFAQYVREVLGKAIHINSGYRTVAYNRKVGGKSGSRHLKGCALDLWMQSVKQQDLANYFYSMGLVRVGVYSSFVHADTDRSPQWLSQRNFRKVNIPCLRTLKQGSKEYLVAIIQYKLNCLGYNCGVEDGIFGNTTKNAVINFQKAKGLTADGIVGKNTWNKLFN